MSEIGEQGRTIVFVSHSMPAILRLCDRALLLDRGHVIDHGSTQQVVRSYLESDIGRTGERRWPDLATAPGDDVARLQSIRVLARGAPADSVDIREPVAVEVEYWSNDPGSLRPFANLHFFDDEGVCLFVTSDTTNREWRASSRTRGLVRSTVTIPGNFLAEGRVIVTAAVSTINPTVVHAIERDAVAFQVVDRSEGDGVRGEWVGDLPGVVRPMLDWTVEIP
jgi:lipopolysaccharide transport system ATP-binding protein